MAEEGANIPEHLDMVKEMWLHINLLQDENFPMSDYIFKVVLALTLPEFWDSFVEMYISNDFKFVHSELRMNITLQEFISLIISEYCL